MKRFKYKFTPVIITFIFAIYSLAILAIIISAIKLFGPPIFNSFFPLLDVITIIISIIAIFVLTLALNLHYAVSQNGIELKLGFVKLKKHSIYANDIQGVIYKAKSNTLLVTKDLSAENILASVINIKSTEYNAFVEAIKNNKIAFTYIEDLD